MAVPSSRAETLARIRTGSVVLTGTLFVATGSVTTLAAGSFALDAAEVGLALADARDGMTGQRATVAAVAGLVAVQPEPAFDAYRTAQGTLETGAA